ncbi:MAG: TVP38/TMEM64 family protein [Pseudomonadota bacterium]
MEEEQSTTKDRGALSRFLPLALIIAGAVAVYASGLYRYLSLDALRDNYGALTSLVADNFPLALAGFMGIYILAVALSLPGASLMTIVGGLMFGTAIGTGAVVLSATIGALIVFIAARTAFGDVLRRQASGFLSRMEEGFRKNAFSYLLLLRVIPAFPFFVVNVAPAFFNVKLGTFALTTLLGIIPGTFAYVSVGNGLGAVIAAGDDINLSGVLLKPEVITPMAALAVLAAIPLAAQAFGAKVDGQGDADTQPNKETHA